MLYAPVEIVRSRSLESRDTYFRSSMRILFMLPILSFFEDFSASLDVEVNVLKISIFLPTKKSENISNQRQMRRTQTTH
jgi:hypothetical protein